jgi:hypothetical protein
MRWDIPVVFLATFLRGGTSSYHQELIANMLGVRHTCECYAVVKKEYDRLLPAMLAT